MITEQISTQERLHPTYELLEELRSSVVVFGRISDSVGALARGPRSKTGFDSQVERMSGVDVVDYISRHGPAAAPQKGIPWRDQTFSSLKP
jgi:hypothetical protein